VAREGNRAGHKTWGGQKVLKVGQGKCALSRRKAMNRAAETKKEEKTVFIIGRLNDARHE